MPRIRAAAPSTDSRARASDPPSAAVVVALLAALLLAQHARSLAAPFFSDDYILLDKIQDASLRSLVAPGTLAYHWYRPWSRELHYAALYHLFGASTLPFHIACFALYLVAMGLFFEFARRVVGAKAAAVATAGVAAMASWGVIVEWGSGSQELWMLVWALVTLFALARGRSLLAMIPFALALLSKETAAVVPVIGVAYAMLLDGAGARAAFRRVAPLIAMTVVWAAFHPALGGRWWWAAGLPNPPEVHTNPIVNLARTVLTLVNLDALPSPVSGWGRAILSTLPGAVILTALAGWGVWASMRRARSAPAASPDASAAARATPADAGSPNRSVAFGTAWAVAAWLPLLFPSLLWQSYYTLFGAMGAWLALSAALASRPIAGVVLVSLVALLNGPRAETPVAEWGNELVMRAGRAFMGETEHWLEARHPRLPHHSRLYFAGVPTGTVFVLGPGDTPALRIWYDDRTLSGSYWSQFTVRAPQAPSGPDFFFRHDSLAGWNEVFAGPENADSTRAASPSWTTDHENLAYVLIEGGDVSTAALEYEKLARAYPARAEYPYLRSLCAESLGDSAGVRQWLGRAVSLPDADDEMREKARRYRVAVTLSRANASAPSDSPRSRKAMSR
jgi:hypothetical protein